MLSEFAQEVDRTIAGESPPPWLRTWADVVNQRWTDVLIGNGCSRAVWPNFGYSTLREVASTLHPAGLSAAANLIFGSLGVADFEAVLRSLSDARMINDALGLETAPVDVCRENVRNALVAAIAAIHPDHATVGTARLDRYSRFLATFGMVFTTNYDLLIYWAMMRDYAKFVDYFWSAESNFTFDLAKTTLYQTKRTVVHYLHGALMLRVDDLGNVYKVVNEDGQPLLLDRIGADIADSRLPIVVSEGYADQKMRSISEHAYLEFASAQLSKSGGPLLILGHGMNHDSDRHILDAIAKSGRQRIGVGIWTGEASSVGALHAEKDRISAALQEGPSRQVLFFDSRTVSCWGA